MNLAVRRFILFFFSIATLSACEDPTDIGLELQDDFQIGTDFTDTLTINSGTVLQNDSIVSFGKSALIGHLADPVMGRVKASYYTELALNGADLNFGESPVAESAVLTLNYDFVYPGRRNNLPITLKVYELTENFQEKTSYFTNAPAPQYGPLLGSVTFTPEIDTLTLNNAVIDRTSLVEVQLPIELAQRLIAQSGQPALANQSNFNNFFKSLAFVVEGDAPSSMIGLNLAPSTQIETHKTLLTLNYKIGEEKKKHGFAFTGPRLRSYTRVTSDRSATALAALQTKGQFIPSSQTGGLSYVQAGTQLFTKVTIPYIKQLKEKHGDVVLNRAELIIPVGRPIEYNEKTRRFMLNEPPAQLVLYETNSTNNILRTANGTPKTIQADLNPSASTYANPTALSYNIAKGHYTVNITSHVQAVLQDKRPNTSILLAPASVNTASGASQISQDIRPYSAVLSNTADKRMKLRVYFSKLN